MREDIIIVPRNEKYVRLGVERIQVPYSLIDINMKPRERSDKKESLSRITTIYNNLGERLN